MIYRAAPTSNTDQAFDKIKDIISDKSKICKAIEVHGAYLEGY